jgi:hypothetical protein
MFVTEPHMYRGSNLIHFITKRTGHITRQVGFLSVIREFPPAELWCFL